MVVVVDGRGGGGLVFVDDGVEEMRLALRPRSLTLLAAIRA